MALEIFKLVGSVFVDTDKANESLQKTDKTASSFASTLGSAVGKAAGVATAVVGMATAVGGAALGVAEKVSQQTDEIDKASIRMGISAESYQELAYAAGQCGVEMSTMESAAKKLEGTDLNFDDAINQIMSLGSAEERSAKAAELFGEKIAYNLSPLIEQSGEDFNGLIQRANDLGLVMSGDSVKAGVEFGDLLSDIKQMAQSLATQIGTALFPIVNEMFQQIIGFMPMLQGYMAQLVPFIVEVVSNLMPVLFEILQQLMPVAIEIVTTILPLALDLVMSLLPVITSLLPLISPIANLLMTILTPLVGLLRDILPPLIDVITQLLNVIIPMLIWYINFVAETVRQVLDGVIRDVKPYLQSVIQMLSGLIEFVSGVFTGDWDKAWNGIVKMFKGYANMLISAINGVINGVIQMVNIIIDSALRIANLIPGVDFDTSVVKIPELNIPLLAKGGVIEQEGSAIVGEKGAELLNLPKGARVSPLTDNEFDYDKLTNSLVNALKETLQITIPVNIGNEYLETIVVDALQTANYRSGGR